MENMADGGAALTAYGKLQYTYMSEDKRLKIKNSLLKYYELEWRDLRTSPGTSRIIYEI